MQKNSVKYFLKGLNKVKEDFLCLHFFLQIEFIEVIALLTIKFVLTLTYMQVDISAPFGPKMSKTMQVAF